MPANKQLLWLELLIVCSCIWHLSQMLLLGVFLDWIVIVFNPFLQSLTNSLHYVVEEIQQILNREEILMLSRRQM